MVEELIFGRFGLSSCSTKSLLACLMWLETYALIAVCMFVCLFVFGSRQPLGFDSTLPGISVNPTSNNSGPVSRKSRKLFGPEKAFLKPRPAYSEKLIFSCVVKEIKIKITFRASRRLKIQDELCHLKCVGTFEKRTPGYLFKWPCVAPNAGEVW